MEASIRFGNSGTDGTFPILFEKARLPHNNWRFSEWGTSRLSPVSPVSPVSDASLPFRPLASKRGLVPGLGLFGKPDEMAVAGKLFEKSGKFLRDVRIVPCLLPLGRMPVFALRPFVELIVRHKKPSS